MESWISTPETQEQYRSRAEHQENMVVLLLCLWDYSNQSYKYTSMLRVYTPLGNIPQTGSFSFFASKRPPTTITVKPLPPLIYDPTYNVNGQFQLNSEFSLSM